MKKMIEERFAPIILLYDDGDNVMYLTLIGYQFQDGR
jgi:hypothetical protein